MKSMSLQSKLPTTPLTTHLIETVQIKVLNSELHIKTKLKLCEVSMALNLPDTLSREAK